MSEYPDNLCPNLEPDLDATMPWDESFAALESYPLDGATPSQKQGNEGE